MTTTIGISSTSTLLTSNSTSNAFITIKPHLSSRIFLQSITCQAISGFFAWAALLITVHHVILFKNFDCFFI